MPLFFGTDYDVRLEVHHHPHPQRPRSVPLTICLAFSKPIPGCASEDNPAKYEVVTAGEHVRARLEAGYSKAKKS
jgi:hypothetical protein